MIPLQFTVENLYQQFLMFTTVWLFSWVSSASWRMDPYDPLASPNFIVMETNKRATSPNRGTQGIDTPAFDNDVSPTYKEPINSQKSTRKSVPMDISPLSGNPMAGSQRSEAAKQKSEAEGRNSRRMISPLRGTPVKSPLRPNQPKTAAVIIYQLNGSFKGVLHDDNLDASLSYISRHQQGLMDDALKSFVRPVHAGELSRVPAHLLSNNQVFLMVTPLVFNSVDNSWACQDGIIVPP